MNFKDFVDDESEATPSARLSTNATERYLQECMNVRSMIASLEVQHDDIIKSNAALAETLRSMDDKIANARMVLQRGEMEVVARPESVVQRARSIAVGTSEYGDDDSVSSANVTPVLHASAATSGPVTPVPLDAADTEQANSGGGAETSHVLPAMVPEVTFEDCPLDVTYTGPLSVRGDLPSARYPMVFTPSARRCENAMCLPSPAQGPIMQRTPVFSSPPPMRDLPAPPPSSSPPSIPALDFTTIASVSRVRSRSHTQEVPPPLPAIMSDVSTDDDDDVDETGAKRTVTLLPIPAVLVRRTTNYPIETICSLLEKWSPGFTQRWEQLKEVASQVQPSDTVSLSEAINLIKSSVGRRNGNPALWSCCLTCHVSRLPHIRCAALSAVRWIDGMAHDGVMPTALAEVVLVLRNTATLQWVLRTHDAMEERKAKAALLTFTAPNRPPPVAPTKKTAPTAAPPKSMSFTTTGATPRRSGAAAHSAAATPVQGTTPRTATATPRTSLRKAPTAKPATTTTKTTTRTTTTTTKRK